MPQGGLAAHHGVLVGPEPLKASSDEMLEHLLGVLPADTPAEGLALSGQLIELSEC